MPVVPVKTYYLEMLKDPNLSVTIPKHTDIIPWTPIIEEYLDIYKQIGDPWGWTGRTQMTKNELSEKLHANPLYQLVYKHKFAGFVELEKVTNNMEIKYFGILNAFQGLGIGGFFLKWSINKAWSYSPVKVVVHTCEYDHPLALNLYQKYGFTLVKTQLDEEFYTDTFLQSRSS